MTALHRAPRRLLRRMGRAVTVQRRNGMGFIAATTEGHQGSYAPEQLVGEIRHGDAPWTVLADAVIAAGLNPPRNGDQLVAGGRTWQILGAQPRMVAERVTHFTLWCRGG